MNLPRHTENWAQAPAEQLITARAQAALVTLGADRLRCFVRVGLKKK